MDKGLLWETFVKHYNPEFHSQTLLCRKDLSLNITKWERILLWNVFSPGMTSSNQINEFVRLCPALMEPFQMCRFPVPWARMVCDLVSVFNWKWKYWFVRFGASQLAHIESKLIIKSPSGGLCWSNSPRISLSELFKHMTNI